MREIEKTINSSELILSNLRHHLRRVEIFVLGAGYHNMEMNAYKADEKVCTDIINAVDELREKNKTLSIVVAFMWVLCFLLICVVLKVLL